MALDYHTEGMIPAKSGDCASAKWPMFMNSHFEQFKKNRMKNNS